MFIFMVRFLNAKRHVLGVKAPYVGTKPMVLDFEKLKWEINKTFLKLFVFVNVIIAITDVFNSPQKLR